jgi:hypothetical protein
MSRRFVMCGIALALVGCSKPVVELKAMNDGSVEDEGIRFKEPDALKAKLLQINKRSPPPEIRLGEEAGATAQSLGPVLVLPQKVGVLKVGFITSPEPRTPQLPN